MKRNLKIVLSTVIGVIALQCVNVAAFSSTDLKSRYDGRYCFYQGKSEQTINETIMDKIETSNTGDGIKITLPKYSGISKYTIVIGGETYQTVAPGDNVTIKASEANGKQIQVYRDFKSNTICRFSETDKNSSKSETCISHASTSCAIGFFNSFNKNYKLVEEMDDLATLEETRNYQTGTSTITISRKTNQAKLTDGSKVKFKVVVYESTNSGLSKKKTLSSSDTSVSFTITPRGEVNTLFVQYIATSGDANGAILSSGEESYVGYEKNTTSSKEYCKTIRNSSLYNKMGDLIHVCNPNYTYVDYGGNLTEKELETKYSVLNKLFEQIKQFEVGNSSLKSITKTSKDRTKKELFCQFNKEKNVTQTYSYDTYEDIDEYFVKVCRETVKITYDSPKLVSNNGGGFSYDVTVTPTVSCYAKIKDDAWEKLISIASGTKCTIKNGCWGTDSNYPGYRDRGYWDGGPSEDFDACVSSCDGGTYSQSCINSCYNKVYGNNSNATIAYNNKNYGLLNISYKGTYADSYDIYTDGWCQNPFKSEYAGDYNNTYYYSYTHNSNGVVTNSKHTGYGRYYCIKAKTDADKYININRYFRTTSCQSTCYSTITNPTTKKSKKYTNVKAGRDYTINASVDSDNYLKELGCYLNTDGTSTVLDDNKIKDFVNKWNALVEEVNKTNDEGADYSKATYTYQIHDSTSSYCNNDEYIEYKSGASTNALSVTTNKQDKKVSNIALGFPNTCLKDGNAYTTKQGCCDTSKGEMTGGKKFYMAITTDNNINNVYSWPTTEKANFTDLEKETINEIRKSIQNKVSGSVLIYDTEEFKSNEKCDRDGYKFNYNIKASLENFGVLGKDGGWNFDINCFYGYYNPNIGSCGVQSKDIDTDGDGELDTTVIKETLCNNDDAYKQPNKNSMQTTTLVNDYIFRTVDVTNLFNSNSEIPWNWKTSKTTEAATKNLEARNIVYKIDPNVTVQNIQSTGYAYEDYRNFHIIMSSNNMRNIRDYNQSNTKITSTSCSSKALGCNNTFVKSNVDTATGDFGITYNNKRDVK